LRGITRKKTAALADIWNGFCLSFHPYKNGGFKSQKGEGRNEGKRGGERKGKGEEADPGAMISFY